MPQSKLSINAKSKMKLKKNALDPVDFAEEKRNDPKYKTEMCKTWIETGFCPYGNKCRFAHGKSELLFKPTSSSYKKKPCKSFMLKGYCPYGTRCNFRHDERKLSEIPLSYYYIKLFVMNELSSSKRLKVFEEISNEKIDYWSDSTLSNEDNYINSNKGEFVDENESTWYKNRLRK